MADDSKEKTSIFAVPNFWQSSKWLDQLPIDDDAPFFSPHLKDASRQSEASLINLGPVATGHEGFFKLDHLSLPHPIESEATDDTQITAPSAADLELGSAYDDDDDDDELWTRAEQKLWIEPTHRTWESFLKGAPAARQPPLVTEAGPAAYDALLVLDADPLGLKNAGVPIIDSKSYLSSLLALALGRQSLLFSKNESARPFQRVLPSVRITGYSEHILQRVEDQCQRCGESVLELRDFVQRGYATRPGQCSVALVSALDEIVQAVQQNVILKSQKPRSILQLQSTVRDILSVLEPLQSLIANITLPSHSEEHLIVLLYEHAYSVENSDSWLRQIMQEVLCRVSAPWTNFLEEWIGLKPEEGIPLGKSDVGKSKGFVKVQKRTYVDDFGQEIEDIDFQIDADRIPYFMPEDVMQQAFETGRNLRFLRASHPNHILVQCPAITAIEPPKTNWLFNWSTILERETSAKNYQIRLRALVRGQHEVGPRSADISQLASASSVNENVSIFALDESAIEQRILASLTQLSAPVVKEIPDSPLSCIIQKRFSAQIQPTKDHADSTPHWSLLPVLSFAGIVSAQANVVNRETLRLLFEAHDLRAHLRLQREYQLFGDGVFCSRLSHALFDPDLERADRQAGVARQGGVMGLRLGGRDTWPPASSELRLALMGVLAESYTAARPHTSDRSALLKGSSNLPGDLSFAVRDLSEKEIDRCMVPDSLEALDFLRLSYKAPPELGFIITPMVLVQYDRIFKHLLRVLRMVYTVDQLWRDTVRCSQELGDLAYRFTRESRHFVSSITSYFLDIGVAGPWQAFESKLDNIQSTLQGSGSQASAEESMKSPEELRELHVNVVTNIMVGLFLRKRQEPVLKLLEEIFSIILEYATQNRVHKSKVESKKLTELYANFRKKVQIFITVCRGLTEKSRTGSRTKDRAWSTASGLGDESMVAQLLMKLDVNNYYTKGQ